VEYKVLKKEQGWTSKLSWMKALESTGQPTLDEVVQVGVEDHMKYSRPTLIQHLVDFIVVDDQVSVSLMIKHVYTLHLHVLS
jgi:hypothetical protein